MISNSGGETTLDALLFPFPFALLPQKKQKPQKRSFCGFYFLDKNSKNTTA
jgi:hypothetical protein